jgi:hypothetical protein
MALARNIMKGGWSAGNAKAVNGAVATALTGSGTTLATALALTADTNVVATAAASSGVSLPSCEIGDSTEVYNGGANALTVYPDVTGNQINGLTAGAGFLLATNTSVKCRKITATRWIAFLSA